MGLADEERSQLKAIINADKGPAHKRRYAQMLLKADQGSQGPAWKDADIAEAFDCHVTTIENLRRRLVERGLDAALEHGNRGSYRARKPDGRAEAYLIALACAAAPEGECSVRSGDGRRVGRVPPVSPRKTPSDLARPFLKSILACRHDDAAGLRLVK